MAVDLVTGIRMLDAVVDVPSSIFLATISSRTKSQDLIFYPKHGLF